MSKIVKGDDFVIKIDEETFLHATSHQLSLTAEFETYQTKDTNGKKKVLTGFSGTASADGLVCVDSTGGFGYDTVAVLDMFYGGQEVSVACEFEGNTYSTSTAYITNIQATGQVAQNSTYSVTVEFDKLEKAE